MPIGVLNSEELALCRRVFRHWSKSNGLVDPLPRDDLAREILRAHGSGADTYAKLVAAITTRTCEAWYGNAIVSGLPTMGDSETSADF
ncbi:TilS substrate-binding domain-containing protein [Mesorhizobium sp. 128a]